MPGGNIGAGAPSARPCVRSSRPCRYRSTATSPAVAGGRGRRGWGGRTAAADNAEMIPILLRDAAAIGRRGKRRRAAKRALPPPTLTAATASLAATAAQGERHGDDGDNDGNNSVHSDSGKHGDCGDGDGDGDGGGGNGDGKGTPPQPPPPSLPTQLLVLACFVILCLLLFFLAPISGMIKVTKCRTLSIITNVPLPS
jgi:hypothetical protein